MHIGEFHPRVGDHKSVDASHGPGADDTSGDCRLVCVNQECVCWPLCNANHECIATCVEWISLECATLSTDATSCPGF